MTPIISSRPCRAALCQWYTSSTAAFRTELRRGRRSTGPCLLRLLVRLPVPRPSTGNCFVAGLRAWTRGTRTWGTRRTLSSSRLDIPLLLESQVSLTDLHKAALSVSPLSTYINQSINQFICHETRYTWHRCYCNDRNNQAKKRLR